MSILLLCINTNKHFKDNLGKYSVGRNDLLNTTYMKYRNILHLGYFTDIIQIANKSIISFR